MRLRKMALLGLAGVALAAGSPGNLDESFDGDGVWVGAPGALLSVAPLGDGKIVAAGTEHGTTSAFTIVRLDADGGLDTGFGSGGIVTPFGSAVASEGQQLILDGNGRIVAVGSATIERTSGSGKKAKTERVQMVALVRLLSDGSHDTSFGDGGEVLTEASALGSGARGLALQADGKIVVAGFAWVKPPKSKGGPQPANNHAVALLRYNADGTLDTSFGTGGIVVDNYTDDNDLPGLNGVALQSDGKILVAGSVGTASPLDAGFVRRYDTDGSLDTAFGAGGTISISAQLHVSPSIAVDGDDRILFASGTGGDGVIARYDEDGVLDTTFGVSGWFETGLSGDDAIRGLEILSDGRIAAGAQTLGNADGFTLRLDADGGLDTTYGSGGISDLTTPGDGTSESIFDFAVDPDGNYLICGSRGGDFLVARYYGN